MILHIALSGLHVRRPTVAQVKTAARLAGYAASVPVVLLAERVGLLWPALLFVAAVAGAVVGRHRGASVERARHVRVMEGMQEVNHQLLMQNERLKDEQRFWWEVDRQCRNDRHINDSRVRSGVGQPANGS